MSDSHLIGGKFLNGECPHERVFFEKYFQGELPRALVSYYYMFRRTGSIGAFHRQFEDHAGLVCSEQRFRLLLKKVECLEADYTQACQEMDFDKIEKIKTGKYKACVKS